MKKEPSKAIGFSPAGIFIITLAGIALAELIAMIVVYQFRDLPYANQVIIDIAVMSVIIFPILYLLSLKPLLTQLQNQQRAETVLQARLHLNQVALDNTLDTLMQDTLDQIERLTGSTIGFFHFLDENEQNIRLHTWSTNTLEKMCKAEGKGSHYSIDKAGVWADAVRRREPVIHNDFRAVENRKGMPSGHAQVMRELVVPILRSQKVVAILGLGNKPSDYTQNDVEMCATFADFAWDVIEAKRSEIALRSSEEKFRNLADWTYDWELWLGPQGDIIYTSPSCERFTGLKPQELMANPNLLCNIVHPDDKDFYANHHEILHDSTAEAMMIDYRLLDQQGREVYVEHICRPLFGSNGQYLGRRISNRDITERKIAQFQVQEKNQKAAELARTIQTIQRDIARDLHDSLGQNIGFLQMNLAHLSESRMDESFRERQIQNMKKAADESHSLIRAMLAILQSDGSEDPLGPFTRYADQIANRAPFRLSIETEGLPGSLPSDQIRHLFYIFREALNNIEKYAQATEVQAHFCWEQGYLILTIRDNGCGFDPQSVQQTNHYGLKFMRERAGLLHGSLEVHAAPNEGTTIIVMVPLEIGQPVPQG